MCLLHKECRNVFKNPDLKSQWFSVCASWFTKGRKILLQQGARHKLSDSISCLCHANNYAFCNLIGALKFESSTIQMTKMSLRTPDPLYTHTWRLQWDYFGSTLWQIALCMIQFVRAVFSENSLCILESSAFLLKCTTSLDTIQTMHVILSGVLFGACLPATVLHDLLKAKFLV